MDESIQTKMCNHCGVTKPVSEFHRRGDTACGRVAHCKACVKAKAASRYAATITDERRAAMAATRREQVARMSPAERDEVRRRNREFMTKRYVVDRQQRAEYMAAYRKANRDYFRNYFAARRALLARVTVGPVDLAALWTGFCAECDEPLTRGVQFPDPRSPSVDHIVPLSKGGPHTQDNLRWVCLGCNLRKGASLPVT